VTESSEHNAEYNPWFIKKAMPELIEQYNIPSTSIFAAAFGTSGGGNRQEGSAGRGNITHSKSKEYASDIIRAVVIVSLRSSTATCSTMEHSNLPDAAAWRYRAVALVWGCMRCEWAPFRRNARR
jgi:hypothetical protein